MSLLARNRLKYLISILLFNLVHQSVLAALVINEFHADPDGADGGKEFVEFYNPGPGSLDIEGLQFQFANGSVGPVWETRWVKVGSQILAEGDFFLLVDRNWLGPENYDAEAWLGLQNGPDAIRLILGAEVLDLVGYGPLTDLDMLEGAAVALPVGQALLRKPDGHDTNNNSADFQPGLPSPGQANFQTHDMEVLQVEMKPPSVARPGSGVLLSVILANTGLDDLQPSGLRLCLQSDDGEKEVLLETFFAGCRSGESCSLSLGFVPPYPGRFSVILELPIPDSEHALEIFLETIQVGSGAVFFTEALAAPASHEGEWIEIQAGNELVELGNYKIRDEDGDWRQLPSVVVQPRGFLLVAQDSVALSSWHHENLMRGVVLDCPVGQMEQVLRSMPSSWPSLNNSPPQGRIFSDRIYLADESGVIDHATLPGDEEDGDFRGTSWERMSHNSNDSRWSTWRACVASQGGTPGCTNSVAIEGNSAAVLEIIPDVIDRAEGNSVAHIRFLLGLGETGWHVEIFDLWGALVRDLGGEEAGPGPGTVIWDGRDDQGSQVGSGGYVVLLLKGSGGGMYTPAAKSLLVVR